MKKAWLLFAVSAVMIILFGCYPPQPRNTDNICTIFQQYPEWYWEAKQTQDKWAVPIAVQMAIIKEESGFQASAEPIVKEKKHKFIFWKRQSSALGYCQALSGTWKCYEGTKGKSASRDQFSDASDFIGWYASQAKQYAHIEPTDAYNLYLAYHEGLGGFHSHSFWKKPWLEHIAHQVQSHADLYASQLKGCEGDIPKPTVIGQ